jgi:hypothetical protein
VESEFPKRCLGNSATQKRANFGLDQPDFFTALRTVKNLSLEPGLLVINMASAGRNSIQNKHLPMLDDWLMMQITQSLANAKSLIYMSFSKVLTPTQLSQAALNSRHTSRG